MKKVFLLLAVALCFTAFSNLTEETNDVAINKKKTVRPGNQVAINKKKTVRPGNQVAINKKKTVRPGNQIQSVETNGVYFLV